MMPATCSLNPSNIDPLYLNGFTFSVQKLPDVTFYVQQVGIPGVSLPAVGVSNPFADVPLPGDKLTYEPLTISYLVDSKLQNYFAVFRWIQGLGFPEDNTQFPNLLASTDFNKAPQGTEYVKSTSDAFLAITDAMGNVVLTYMFHDLVPTSLGGLEFDATTADTPVGAIQATFSYSTFDVARP